MFDIPDRLVAQVFDSANTVLSTTTGNFPDSPAAVTVMLSSPVANGAKVRLSNTGTQHCSSSCPASTMAVGELSFGTSDSCALAAPSTCTAKLFTILSGVSSTYLPLAKYPLYALDSDPATEWYSDDIYSNNHFFEIDLGVARTVTQLQYTARSAGQNGRAIEFVVSAGTASLSVVTSGVFSTTSTAIQAVAIPNVLARFWRLTIVSTHSSRFTSIAELAVTVTPCPVIPVLSSCTVPRLQTRIFSVSSTNVDDIGAYAIDGDAGSAWLSADVTSLNHFIEIDLGASYTLAQIQYTARSASQNGRIVQFQLLIGVLNQKIIYFFPIFFFFFSSRFDSRRSWTPQYHYDCSANHSTFSCCHRPGRSASFEIRIWKPACFRRRADGCIGSEWMSFLRSIHLFLRCSAASNNYFRR